MEIPVHPTREVIVRLQLVEPAPLTLSDRIARLRDEELRVLAASVGDHLPVELAERASVLRAERRRLEQLA